MLDIYVKWAQIKGESVDIETTVKPQKPEEIYLAGRKFSLVLKLNLCNFRANVGAYKYKLLIFYLK